MLHHRQELDVGEADVGQIVGELRSKFAIGQRSIAFLGDPPPGAEMHLVDRDWATQWIALSRADIHAASLNLYSDL